MLINTYIWLIRAFILITHMAFNAFLCVWKRAKHSQKKMQIPTWQILILNICHGVFSNYIQVKDYSKYSILELEVYIKGQLISDRPFGFIVWTKLPMKFFLNICPEFFCTFSGASWKLFGASCRLSCLWYHILSPKEAQRASMKPPGSYKKTQGRNPEIIFVQTMKPKGHFEIKWPLVNSDVNWLTCIANSGPYWDAALSQCTLNYFICDPKL